MRACVSRNKRSATAYLVTFTFASFATVCPYNMPRKLLVACIKAASVALLCQTFDECKARHVHARARVRAQTLTFALSSPIRALSRMPHLRCIRRGSPGCSPSEGIVWRRLYRMTYQSCSPLGARERALNDRCKNPAYDIYRVRGRLQIPYPVATRFRATTSGGGRFSGIYQNANPRSTFRAAGRAVAIPAARVPSSREYRHRYRATYIS